MQTVDKTKPYAVTGAPRVFKDKVIIGNGAAEFSVRGYVTTYDTETGKYKWHYQESPGDSWDYTATQPIMLATLPTDMVGRQYIAGT